MPLPHESPDVRKSHQEPEFITVDDEIRRRWKYSHPDYGEGDKYGNPARPMVPNPDNSK